MVGQERHFTCIAASHGAAAVPATKNEWLEVRRSKKVEMVAAQIAETKNDELVRRLKSSMPVWTPRCARFSDDHRKEACAEAPLQRLMIDIDEKGRTEEVMARLKDGRIGQFRVLLVEESLRKGTHVLLVIPGGMKPEEVQQEFSEVVGMPVDVSVKNVAGCIYQVPDTYTKYVDEELYEPTPALASSEATTGIHSEATPNVPTEATTGTPSEPTPNAVESPTPSCLPLQGAGVSENGVSASLPYHLILPAFFQMQCASYPDVPEGKRNDTIFNVCAKYLRYCTDHKAEKMKELLWPKYSFGLSESEVDGIIRSALSRERGLTPKTVDYVLEKFGVTGKAEPTSMADAEEDGTPYRPLEDYIIDESLLPTLPRWLNVLLKVAPPGYRFITLGGTMPAIQTLLTDVSCKFGNKKVTRLNAWYHVDGPPASNKSITLAPIPVLMKPLQDEDNANLAREDAYYEKKEECVNKKDQPKKPKDIVVRILPPNTTRHQHMVRMRDAKGKQTYTYCEEVQSLDMANRSSYCGKSDWMQLMFDNGMTGNEAMTTGGLRVRCQVRWNISSSGTRDQTLRTFSNVTNGAVTRVFFLLMPDASRAPMPQYVQYTEQDEELIHRAARILMRMQGLVYTPKLDRALMDWVEKVRLESLQDTERLTLKNRSADIAHKFGVAIHLAWVVQQILDQEDREGTPVEVGDMDLSHQRERQQTIDMAIYAANQCLENQYRLWAKKMRQQLQSAYDGTAVFKARDNQFALIPSTFTYASLEPIFPTMKPASLRKMVERFRSAGTVVDAGFVDGIKLFRKIEKK